MANGTSLILKPELFSSNFSMGAIDQDSHSQIYAKAMIIVPFYKLLENDMFLTE